MEGYLVTGTPADDGAVSGRAIISVDVMANGSANAGVAISEVTKGGNSVTHVWPDASASGWGLIPIGATGDFSRGDFGADTAETAIAGQFYGADASEVGGVFLSVDSTTGISPA